jgi:hypothetical protein
MLQLYGKILAPEHPHMSASMHNLTLMLRDQHKYKTAEKMH